MEHVFRNLESLSHPSVKDMALLRTILRIFNQGNRNKTLFSDVPLI